MTVISKIFSVILSFVMAFLPVGNAFTNEASNTPASDNYPYTLEDMSVVYDNVDENGN